jgi:hypothetical protein
MDLYLIWWVGGALPTWWVLSRKGLPPFPLDLYYACILLWPIVWVLCAITGLFSVGIELSCWFRNRRHK